MSSKLFCLGIKGQEKHLLINRTSIRSSGTISPGRTTCLYDVFSLQISHIDCANIDIMKLLIIIILLTQVFAADTGYTLSVSSPRMASPSPCFFYYANHHDVTMEPVPPTRIGV